MTGGPEIVASAVIGGPEEGRADPVAAVTVVTETVPAGRRGEVARGVTAARARKGEAGLARDVPIVLSVQIGRPSTNSWISSSFPMRRGWTRWPSRSR